MICLQQLQHESLTSTHNTTQIKLEQGKVVLDTYTHAYNLLPKHTDQYNGTLSVHT